MQSDDPPIVRPWWFMPASILLGLGMIVIFVAVMRLLASSPLSL